MKRSWADTAAGIYTGVHGILFAERNLESNGVTCR
jgi:hypothetical protein